MTLSELKIGESAVVTAVGGEGILRRRLLDMGITPKAELVVRKMTPLGDPIEIRIRGDELSLRKEDAAKITVEKLSESGK